MSRRTLTVAGTCFVLGLILGAGFGDSLTLLAQGDEAAPSRNQMYDELATAAAAFEQQGRVLAMIYDVIRPAVVHIDAKKGTTRTREEAGSGVIVGFASRPGRFFVLTNGHVIRNASLERITIKLADGRELNPIKTWIDGATDVAVMEIKAPRLETAHTGDSDQIRIGQFALAVGSPFGLSHSVTFGIVSATGRRDLDLGNGEVKYKEFIQTDAAINPGNSGGPLVNLRGEVVGINTAIASNSGGSEGIGFSIPVNMALKVAEQLIAHGNVARAFLGVTLDRDFGPSDAAKLGLPSPRGARVSAIRPGTPAANAGIEPDDVILEFNGTRIDDDIHLVNVVSLTDVGAAVTIRVWRNRKPLTLKVAVGDRKKLAPEQ